MLTCRAANQLRLVIGGDLMLGRSIDAIRPIHNPVEFGKPNARHPDTNIGWAEALGNHVLRNATATDLWGEALEIILASEPDLTLFNLETAVTQRDSWIPKAYNFRMHPSGLDLLKAARIDCVSMANNHTLDFGLAGLLDTLEALDAMGIGSAGAGLNSKNARAPREFQLPYGRRALIFAMACCNSGCHPWEAALPHRPGIALLPDLKPDTARSVCELILSYRQPRDLIIVSLHWGGNWPAKVPEDMRTFGRLLIKEADVHLIHGHSSHWPMEVEEFENSLILYGCGDVLNDYEGRPDFIERRSELGTIFAVDYSSKDLDLIHWQHLPIRRKGFCLKLASAEDAKYIDARLGQRSADKH